MEPLRRLLVECIFVFFPELLKACLRQHLGKSLTGVLRSCRLIDREG
jgi:hypothetical protein